MTYRETMSPLARHSEGGINCIPPGKPRTINSSASCGELNPTFLSAVAKREGEMNYLAASSEVS